jgi:hypothetical protein
MVLKTSFLAVGEDAKVGWRVPSPARSVMAGRDIAIGDSDPDLILHLLWIYQSVIALRPIERGNRGFLESHLKASRMLIERAANAGHHPDVLGPIVRLIKKQVPATAATSAREVIALLKQHNPMAGARVAADGLYVKGLLGPLASRYDSVTVIFGPGLGMGDEITFHRLIANATRHQVAHVSTIFSLYPGLWTSLLPGTRCYTYRDWPLRPLRYVSRHWRDVRKSASGRHLVIFADFDGYGFHARAGLNGTHGDVLEIALGLRRVWLRRFDSPWIEWDDFADGPVANNYLLLNNLERRLFAPGASTPPWQVLRKRRRKAPRAVRTILINASSSKSVPLTAAAWSRFLDHAMGRPKPAGSTKLLVFPGVDDRSRVEAEALAGSLARTLGVPTRVLSDRHRRNLTPFTGLGALMDVVDDVDLCVTVDTFTAHLIPLFSVPTLVIALKQNREFWVPARHVFHWVVGGDESWLRFLISALLDRSTIAKAMDVDAARNLIAATDATLRRVGDTACLGEFLLALNRHVGGLGNVPHLRTEGEKWLRFFSRLLSAMRRAPLPEESLMPFLSAWESTDSFKLAALA